ncbi:uncharacterized protein LW94_14424 [Fusarium fujikuroi]|uniref:Uncharacterized protein n=1 Tax=Fusarium fujikuroi TaxID=5127 RepID=A0A9Q9S1A2_FUSFU|nr:uncharacterized protein LW94_14424 [Fusarium fujikuroi]SCO50110.1 uncharacterized protein FFMR_10090 [Fusarium fujikuroi]VTT83257.1 unnamed protein product [Fusarium fujikuroi]VZH92348.1 unnamed protein product [Fusarium fujikuroi]
MVKLRLTNNSSTKEKDTPMPATPSNGQVDLPFRLGLRFRPHDGTTRAQDRDFIKLTNAPAKVPMHQRDLPCVYKAARLAESIIAAFKEVEQTMPLDLAVKLKQAVVQTLGITSTAGCISKTKVSTLMPYLRLAGKHGIKKQLGYPDWFFLAAWLGPGHPFLESIRKDMSDVWGVEFPTDAIIYPAILNRETEERLFNGEIAPATNEESLEERAKAIMKTINESSVNGLSAAIKDHLPDAFKDFGDSNRMHTLETSLASTNRDLEHARKQVNSLEKELAESKALQAKTKNDMETLRKELKQLKAAQGSTNNVKKDLGVLRATVTGMEAKVLKGERDMITLRNEVAHSAEKAEKALETGALVLSVLSTSGGQKRKMDEIS